MGGDKNALQDKALVTYQELGRLKGQRAAFDAFAKRAVVSFHDLKREALKVEEQAKDEIAQLPLTEAWEYLRSELSLHYSISAYAAFVRQYLDFRGRA